MMMVCFPEKKQNKGLIAENMCFRSGYGMRSLNMDRKSINEALIEAYVVKADVADGKIVEKDLGNLLNGDEDEWLLGLQGSMVRKFWLLFFSLIFWVFFLYVESGLNGLVDGGYFLFKG